MRCCELRVEPRTGPQPCPPGAANPLEHRRRAHPGPIQPHRPSAGPGPTVTQAQPGLMVKQRSASRWFLEVEQPRKPRAQAMLKARCSPA